MGAGGVEHFVLFLHLSCRFEMIAEPGDTGFIIGDTTDEQSGGKDLVSNRERPALGWGPAAVPCGPWVCVLCGNTCDGEVSFENWGDVKTFSDTTAFATSKSS